MGHGVGNQTDVQLLGNLFHDGRFPDAGRAHQQNRPLADGGKQIISPFILAQVGTKGILNFLFCFLNVHKTSLITAQWGRSSG